MKRIIVLILTFFSLHINAEILSFDKYDISSSKKITKIKEVYYFYWNFCDDCKKINSEILYLEEELKKKNIIFKKLPVIWGTPEFDNVARYYIALNLYGNDKLKEDFFNIMLDNENKSISFKEFRSFLKNVLTKKEEIKVLKLINSEAVSIEINKIKLLQETYNIYYVPSILIEKKFLINGNLSGSDSLIVEESLNLINNY